MKSDLSRRSSIKPIFVAAQRLTTSEERHAYLQEACGEDSDLRTKVEELLAALDQASSSPLDEAVEKLGSAQTGFRDTASEEEIDVSSHPMIGSYKLLERLGEGGMGTVYMAQQQQPVKRKVALKVIKPGMDSKEVIARFEAERQALAMMDHSNIARIFDGGLTDQGRPYFVMELVRGLPIDEYCDEATLSLRDRLKLFTDVCRAVQHAHQKGVIHRDLKPSNILITIHDSIPVVKVIDFGIAKALDYELTDRTLFTRFAELVGTPVYMSPEQAELSGVDVDTRSDIYSLGVMLYKLLVGVTPFDEHALKSAGLDEMRRIIREDEPFRPSHKVSTLNNELVSTVSARRGVGPRELTLSMKRELDWIVMKTLEKDRNRRYESASALAQDIVRYLDDEPVEACPPSVSYRVRKYAIRHKGLLTTAALLVVMLLTSTIVSSVFAFQAQQAKEDAEQSAEDAKVAQQAAVEGKEEAVAAQQQAIESQKASEANLSAALDAVDKLLQHASSPALVEIPQAQAIRQKILEDVLAFYTQFKVKTGDSETLTFRAALTWVRLGEFGDELHQVDLARKGFDEAIKLLTNLTKQSPDHWEYQDWFMNASQKYGWFLVHSHERQQAQHCFERARMRADELLLAAAVDQPEWIRKQLVKKQVQARMGLAYIAKLSGGHKVHRDMILDAYRLIDNNFDAIPTHESVGLLQQLAEIHESSNPELADQFFRKGVEMSHKVLQETSIRSGRSWHAEFLHVAAEFFRSRNPIYSEELEKESVAISEKLVFDFPTVPDYHKQLAEKLVMRADPIARLTQAIEQHPDTNWYSHFRGVAHKLRGEFELALADFNRAIELDSSESAHHTLKAGVLSQMGQYANAIAEYDEAIELNPKTAWNWCGRAKLLMIHFQKYEEALSDFDRAIELNGEAHFIQHRAKAHFHLNQYDQALADLNNVLDIAPDTPSVALSIPPSDVASCPDEEFKTGMQALANRAVELNNRSAASLTTRSKLLISLGEWEQAFADLEAVIELHPEDHLTQNNLARHLATHRDAKLRNPGKAVALAERAIALAPTKAIYWNTLGMARYRAGEYENAIVALKKSEELFEGEPTPFTTCFLAMAYWQIGQKAEALDWYGKAAALIADNASNNADLHRIRSEVEALIQTAADGNDGDN